jgi:hypothetical protein
MNFDRIFSWIFEKIFKITLHTNVFANINGTALIKL